MIYRRLSRRKRKSMTKEGGDYDYFNGEMARVGPEKLSAPGEKATRPDNENRAFALK